MVNELPIEKPEDYTPDEAQSIEQELAATYDSTYCLLYTSGPK